MNRAAWQWGVGIVVVAVVGAALREARDPSGVVEEHRARVEAKLAALEEIGRGIAAVPPVPEQAPPVIVPEGAPLPNARTNTMGIQAEDLLDVGRQPAMPVRVCANRRLVGAAQVVRRGVWDSPPLPLLGPRQAVRDLLARVESLRYLLVVRGGAQRLPQVVEGAPEQFRSGAYAGEVLVYDVDARRYLGGVRFEAKKQLAAWVRPEVNPDQAVIDNLAQEAHEAFRQAVEGHVPGFARRAGLVDPGDSPADPCDY